MTVKTPYLIVRREKDQHDCQVSCTTSAELVERMLACSGAEDCDYEFRVFKLDGLPEVKSVVVEAKEALTMITYTPTVPTPIASDAIDPPAEALV